MFSSSILRRALGAALSLTLLAPVARAEFQIPGYELVHTVPQDTALATPDLRESDVVWSEMFDSAREQIVIGQFYAGSKAGSRFDAVIEHLEAAGRRGVHIRFLMEEKGKPISDPATIARLQRIPHLEFRFLEYARLSDNGIIHAKYFVVDGKSAFLGSQNFDWRSFEHIHETGMRITEPVVAAQLQAVFESDWAAQALLAQGQPAPPLHPAGVDANAAAPAHNPDAYLVASPYARDPAGVADSEAELVKLLGQAKREVEVQLLDYAPLSYGPNHTRPYYAVIDDALRAAVSRGVHVKLMVSHWNTEAPAIAYLQSLAVLPGMDIRIVTLPEAHAGFIPFARVIHTKTMVIDDEVAWIGTSNWTGGYLDHSRNLELVLRNKAMAQRLHALHTQTWDSPYAQPVDVLRVYPKPVKG
jgi:phosphatidylserine/phosphatidylglycerophosphate/cardiolipin synthase-like enzyme